MIQVIVDLRAKESIRANRNWDLTDNVCLGGGKIIDSFIRKKRNVVRRQKILMFLDCQGSTGEVHKDDLPLISVMSRYLIPILRMIQE